MAGNNFMLKKDSDVFNTIPDFENIDVAKIGNFNELLNKKINNGVILAINKAGIC